MAIKRPLLGEKGTEGNRCSKAICFFIETIVIYHFVFNSQDELSVVRFALYDEVWVMSSLT